MEPTSTELPSLELTGVELTSEQRDLRDAVRGLLAKHDRHAPPPPGLAPGAGSAAAADDDRARWDRLCGEIGVAGLAVPERYGGAGAGPVEIHIVMEEIGRGLTPAPMLGSAVLAAQALLASGDAAACERLLPGIADGSTVAALAWTGESGHWDPRAAACRARPAAPGTFPGGAAAAAPATSPSTARAGGWQLTGEAHHVLDGDAAGVLLVAAHAPDGIALFEVDPHGGGVARRAVTTMDTTRRLAVVRLAGAAGQPIGGCPGSRALARARDLACIALSAEQVGAAQRALELTVAYTKDRVQFGRAIGGFQALQHRMADLHVLVESARSLSYAVAAAASTAAASTAATSTAGGAADPGLSAAAAKAYCSEVLTRVASEMIQLHGAIGVTWEHNAHRYLKRAHGAGHLFGPPASHLARIATAILDSPAVPDS
jgi:hypothetical protein